MAIQVFDSDDTPYLMWMASNPSAFVLNTERAQKSVYAVLHKPKCHHITTTVSLEKGAYTERNYIKVCADDLYEISDWLEENRPRFIGAMDECKTCKPLTTKYLDNPVLLFPESIEQDADLPLIEGAVKAITVNAYERNPRARAACIRHYGTHCQVCNFSFEEKYGEIGRAFIHVHHLTPVHSIGKTYIIDPIANLRPVCPNCHAMLHQRKPCYTIEELKNILARQLNKRKL